MFHCDGEEEKEKLLENSYLVHLPPLLVPLKDTADGLEESWPFIGLNVLWRCGRVCFICSFIKDDQMKWVMLHLRVRFPT